MDESIATDQLPSTETSDEPILYVLEGRDRTRIIFRPTHVPYADNHLNSARSRWVTNDTTVCYTYYKRGDHIAPSCTVRIRKAAKLIENYNSLQRKERDRVQILSYGRAKDFMGEMKDEEQTSESAEETTPGSVGKETPKGGMNNITSQSKN